jgi:hypothetical protein
MRFSKVFKNILWASLSILSLFLVIIVISELFFQYYLVQSEINEAIERHEECKINQKSNRLFKESCQKAEIITNSYFYGYTEPFKRIYVNVVNEGGILYLIWSCLKVFGLADYNYILLALFGIWVFFKLKQNNNNTNPLIIFPQTHNAFMDFDNINNTNNNKQKHHCLPSSDPFQMIVENSYQHLNKKNKSV